MTITENPLLGRLRILIRTPQAGRFVLNTSRLNSTDRLANATNSYTRPDILGDVVQTLTISRPLTDAGTLNFTLKDAETTGLRPGSWITVESLGTSGWVILFSGTIRSFTTTVENGHTYTTVAATNCYTELANITRYGAASGKDTPDTWAERVTRLLASAPDLARDLTLTGTTSYPAADSVHETSLANWLDIMVASHPRAIWYVTRDNAVRVNATPLGATSGYTYRAFPFEYPADDVIPYSSVEVSFDTADVINEVQVTNHRRTLNDQNEWQAVDETTTYEDVTSRATWGAGSVSVDVCLNDPADVDTVAKRFFTEPALTARSLRVNAQANLTAVARSELGEIISVDGAPGAAEPSNRRIVGITHEIDPTRWITTYELGEPN